MDKTCGTCRVVSEDHPAGCDWHLDQSMYDCTCGFYKPCQHCWFGHKIRADGDWEWCDKCSGTGICASSRVNFTAIIGEHQPKEPTR